MATVQESFGAKLMAASGVVMGTQGGALGGFLCSASGNLKLTQTDAAGATIVDTTPVTAGVFLPLPFAIPPGFAVYATLSNGATGTFAVI